MTSIDTQQLPDEVAVSGTLPAPRLEDFADGVIYRDQVTGDSHGTYAYWIVSSDNLDQVPVTIQDQHHLVREFVDFEDLEPHGWGSAIAGGIRIELYGGSYVMSMGNANGSTYPGMDIEKRLSNFKVGSGYRLTAKVTGTGSGVRLVAQGKLYVKGWHYLVHQRCVRLCNVNNSSRHFRYSK